MELVLNNHYIRGFRTLGLCLDSIFPEDFSRRQIKLDTNVHLYKNLDNKHCLTNNTNHWASILQQKSPLRVHIRVLCKVHLKDKDIDKYNYTHYSFHMGTDMIRSRKLELT